ncbi:MAG: CPBP family intramembrane metalloprotease [Bryobacterales bacterium]|nr:CPBP family intramembrane metalloprotease [Bryobacterales bacterium]
MQEPLRQSSDRTPLDAPRGPGFRPAWPPTGLILRTALQLLIFTVAATVALNLAAFLLAVIPNILLVSAFAMFLGSIAATALVMRIYYHTPVWAVGLVWNSDAARNLGIGLLVGVSAGVLVTLIPVALGSLRWEASGSPFSLGALMMFLALILLGAIGEEVLFRGFPLQRLTETFGAAPAVVVTSLVFGWMHTGNLSFTGLAFLNTILWGMVFAAAWLKSRDLWLPIGLHAGWNWILPLLGVELSGFTLEVTGYRLVGEGTIWDGGAYGPEAGILTTLLVPVMLLVIWRLPVRRCRFNWLEDAEHRTSNRASSRESE